MVKKETLATAPVLNALTIELWKAAVLPFWNDVSPCCKLSVPVQLMLVMASARDLGAAQARLLRCWVPRASSV